MGGGGGVERSWEGKGGCGCGKIGGKRRHQKRKLGRACKLRWVAHGAGGEGKQAAPAVHVIGWVEVEGLAI